MAMLCEQVPIHFADENPAVLVPQPRGDGHKVQAVHHAHAREVVAEVVKREPRKARFYPHESQAVAKSHRALIRFTALR